VVVDANDFFLIRAKIFRTSLESNQDGVGVTYKTDSCTSLLQSQ
jgi:hypothetical protein